MRSALLPLTLCVAFVAAPLTAQRMGSANRGAPKAGCFIEFRGGNKIEVSYSSITLAQGRFMQRLQDMRKEGDAEEMEGFTERFNASAKRRPLGKLKITGKITLGGKEIPEGEYGLAFMLDKSVSWQIVLVDDDQETKGTWMLKTKAPKATSRRLNIWLAANDQGGADLGLSFGDILSKVDVTAGKRERPTSRRARGATTRRRR